jgi:hypothetical protein
MFKFYPRIAAEPVKNGYDDVIQPLAAARRLSGSRDYL